MLNDSQSLSSKSTSPSFSGHCLLDATRKYVPRATTAEKGKPRIRDRGLGWRMIFIRSSGAPGGGGGGLAGPEVSGVAADDGLRWGTMFHMRRELLGGR